MRSLGFTLTELLIVLVVLALAAGVVYPALSRLVDGAAARREAVAAAQAERRDAFHAFVRDTEQAERWHFGPAGETVP